jgi:hypothetical protein
MGKKLINFDANMRMAFIIDDVNFPRNDEFNVRSTDELLRY